MPDYETESAGGQLVPQNSGQLEVILLDPQMQMLADALGSSSSLEVSNFDGDPQKQWELSSKCTDGECIPLDDMVGKPMNIVYVYMHGVQVSGESAGEIRDCVRTSVIDADGIVYSAVSAGIAMSCYRLLKVFGRKPFTPAKRMTVNRSKTRKGWKVLTLVPMPESK